MRPLPQSPAPSWQQYVLRAVIWVAFVGALGYAAANGGLDFLEHAVSLKLEPNRERVGLSGNVPPVIEVKVTLKNNTSQDVTLHAPSACKIFRWQVFSRSGELMQSKVHEDSCPNAEVSVGLGTGLQIEEFYSINLAAARFSAGQDYQVRVWYWGYEKEFQFTAE